MSREGGTRECKHEGDNAHDSFSDEDDTPQEDLRFDARGKEYSSAKDLKKTLDGLTNITGEVFLLGNRLASKTRSVIVRCAYCKPDKDLQGEQRKDGKQNKRVSFKKGCKYQFELKPFDFEGKEITKDNKDSVPLCITKVMKSGIERLPYHTNGCNPTLEEVNIVERDGESI